MSYTSHIHVQAIRLMKKKFPTVRSLISFDEWESWGELTTEEAEHAKASVPNDTPIYSYHCNVTPTEADLRALIKRVKDNDYLYTQATPKPGTIQSDKGAGYLETIENILQTPQEVLSYFDVRDLNSIAKLYSPEALNLRKAWTTQWKTNYSKYEKSMYFLTSCVDRWGQPISYFFSANGAKFDENFAPPFETYCRAFPRHIKRAEGYLSEPKYAVEDIVELRPLRSSNYELRIFNVKGLKLARSDYRRWRKIAGFGERAFVVIIGVDAIAPRGDRKGNKLYTVFSRQDPRPFLIEESLIKKLRAVKRKGK
jgi:hypothetical protein